MNTLTILTIILFAMDVEMSKKLTFQKKLKLITSPYQRLWYEDYVEAVINFFQHMLHLKDYYSSMKKILITILLMGAPFLFAFAQISETEDLPLVPEDMQYVQAKVIDSQVDEQGYKIYYAELKDGKIIEVDSYGEPVEIGSRIFLQYFPDEDLYNFITVNRNTSVIALFVIFVGSILLLARKKGVRSLLSLTASFLLLFFGLVPLLLNGYDPILTSLFFGLAVLFLSIFVTHGFNWQSFVSFLGSVTSILIAIILLSIISDTTLLTGLINEHVQYLSFEVGDTVNLVRLISASIIIGILGVLDDITITQVAVVRELSSDNTLSKKNIFTKALNVGKDHIASLVNTLVFAYVGATLPLIMFIALLKVPIVVLLSQEFIFVEIARSLIGAIALTIAVPVTTWLAVFVFLKPIHKDACSLESACAHTHH